jgi:hypothetical protein
MLNTQVVLQRVRKLAAFQNMNESDFRAAYFGQEFTPPAGGVPTAYRPRQFPNGAIIIGISASAYVPGGDAAAQSARNRQLFSIDFAYNGGEALVIDGPMSADALLGGGDSDNFPVKELIMAPNQSLSCRVANLTTGPLTVDVCYTCLVYRFAG